MLVIIILKSYLPILQGVASVRNVFFFHILPCGRVVCENIDGGHEPPMVPMFWKHRCYRCFTRCFCTSKTRSLCL